MYLVDKPRLHVLPDGRNSASQTHILIAGGLASSLERGVNSIGDEVERGAAIHGDRRASVVGEDKHLRVVGRSFAPPTFPVVVGPRSSNWAKHVAAHDPRSDVFEAAFGEVVVDACGAAALSVHLLKRAG